MATALGEQLIRSLVDGDFTSAQTLVANSIEFKGLTPYGLFEADNSDDAFAILQEWFTPAESVESLVTGSIFDRQKMNYVVACRNPENNTEFIFEQGAFYDVSEGKITHLHLVCSGDRSPSVNLTSL